MRLLAPPAEGTFGWHEVSSRVNHADNDDAELLLPITDEQRAAEASKPPNRLVRKAAAAADDGQGSLF
jgi:hypothetical protein